MASKFGVNAVLEFKGGKKKKKERKKERRKEKKTAEVTRDEITLDTPNKLVISVTMYSDV